MIYVYAITESAAPAPAIAGIDDAELSSLSVEGAAAVYSVHPEADIAPGREAVWRHELVVEELMRVGPILPARFGTAFAHKDALESVLEDRAPELRGALERVRGCVELAVRVRLPEAEAADQRRDGRAYLEAKLARHEQEEHVAESMLRPLGQIAVASSRRRAAERERTLKASYLVRATDVRRFAEEAQRLADRNAELELSCTGPWAPYSFVEEEQA